MTKLDLKWMNNDEWWTVDEAGYYCLTEKAPKEAIESFNRYLEQIRKKTKTPAITNSRKNCYQKPIIAENMGTQKTDYSRKKCYHVPLDLNQHEQV